MLQGHSPTTNRQLVFSRELLRRKEKSGREDRYPVKEDIRLINLEELFSSRLRPKRT